jgi:quercetin dioxygenase-like cupin family protein
MTPDSGTQLDPVSLAEGEGEALWFLGGLLTIKVDGKSTGGRFGVIEQLGPRGAGSPLHVHRKEDEWFYVIEGEIRFGVGEERFTAGPGGFVYGPRDVPHIFTVTSETARFLVGAEPAGFEDFVRELSEPATELALPPAEIEQPTPERLGEVAAKYEIEILGPPEPPD